VAQSDFGACKRRFFNSRRMLKRYLAASQRCVQALRCISRFLMALSRINTSLFQCDQCKCAFCVYSSDVTFHGREECTVLWLLADSAKKNASCLRVLQVKDGASGRGTTLWAVTLQSACVSSLGERSFVSATVKLLQSEREPCGHKFQTRGVQVQAFCTKSQLIFHAHPSRRCPLRPQCAMEHECWKQINSCEALREQASAVMPHFKIM
jgi:hypothetical protein